MGWGAAFAAVANVLILVSPGFYATLGLRFFTGVALAAVYPPALKEISTWFRAGRGKALGLMVAALTMGSALPHLVNAFGGLDWRVVISVTSGCAAAGAVLIMCLRHSGPYPFPKTNFRLSAAVGAVRSRPVVLANIGYIGHMWELYAMWAWVGAFIATLSPFASGSVGRAGAAATAFACIAVGSIGCIVGGFIGDRYGRARSAFIALVCSGGSALLLALLAPSLPAVVVIALCVFWGFWVIADSAQFSALVTEYSEPEYVGSTVSLQLALGFIVTNVTIWAVPVIVAEGSWSLALAFLAVGPALGAAAMRVFLRDFSSPRVRSAPV
jgi:MFS family permease